MGAILPLIVMMIWMGVRADFPAVHRRIERSDAVTKQSEASSSRCKVTAAQETADAR